MFGLLVAGLAACTPPRGGWDHAALLEAVPALHTVDRNRLGDLLPFPALTEDDARVALIACRFSTGQTIRIAGDGVDWPAEWAQAAVDSLRRGADAFALDLLPPGLEPDAAASVEIQITAMDPPSNADEETRGPAGLADTLTECDISRRSADQDAVRGVLERAEIRITPVRFDRFGRRRVATAEEWVGALMHELAHALGFSGHVLVGDSILALEPSRIRANGRRALKGAALRDPTLEALYRLQPGQQLGLRALHPDSAATLRALRRRLRLVTAATGDPIEIRSTVGDRSARIRWHLADGRRLTLQFPDWRDEMRAGSVVTLRASAETRRWLHSAP